MADELAADIRSFVEEELVLDPDDVRSETRANPMSFSFYRPVDEQAVRLALLDVGAALKLMLGDREGPIAFYAWYDEMVGHLRCSVASVPLDRLPFGAPIRVVNDPGELVGLLTADPHPGVIPLDQFVEVDPNGPSTPEPVREPFPVFAMSVAG